MILIEGRRKWFHLRGAVRVAADGGEAPLVLIPEVKKDLLESGSTRLVLLRWDRADFLEKAGSQSSRRHLTGADFLSPESFGKGGKIVASEIEQTGAAWRDKISRLVLFEVE
jgi:hypothetical protein